MREDELELEIVCVACRKSFRRFKDLLIWHVPKPLLEGLGIKGSSHLKCPFCRGNRFIIKVLKDKYGEYE